MKKISSLVLILFFPFRGIAQDIDPYELTLEQLGQIHIYTASRGLTDIDKAPAVVTVITREEIERHGYQNLRDALQRAPGFFVSTIHFQETFYNRGFSGADGIVGGYLLLIEGHSQNLRYFSGMHNLHICPLLAEVERIEIIRGPGNSSKNNK